MEQQSQDSKSLPRHVLAMLASNQTDALRSAEARAAATGGAS